MLDSEGYSTVLGFPKYDTENTTTEYTRKKLRFFRVYAVVALSVSYGKYVVVVFECTKPPPEDSK